MDQVVRCLNEAHGDSFALYNGDCVEVLRQMPDACVGLGLYSPPFSSLYTYSDAANDMGNCTSDEQFYEQYSYLVRELHRVLKPGRLVAVHCKDLVDYAGSSETGMAGLRDFPGELIRIHKAAGFAWHSRVTIWKCPVTEMQRTKAHGLLYKQLRADSTFSRQGLAEYLLVFRKWALEGDPVEAVRHTADEFPLTQWQEWASPVWMTIDQTNVLNVAKAREDRDEKHMCPLQLDVIERAIVLWSNPGDVVLSPFAGIGSEGFGAIQRRRRFVGIELKPSYFRDAARNLAAAGQTQGDLFGRKAASE